LTRSYYVAQAGLKLQSSCLHLPSAGIVSMIFLFLDSHQPPASPLCSCNPHVPVWWRPLLGVQQVCQAHLLVSKSPLCSTLSPWLSGRRSPGLACVTQGNELQNYRATAK
jgi:hypothetical protein